MTQAILIVVTQVTPVTLIVVVTLVTLDWTWIVDIRVNLVILVTWVSPKSSCHSSLQGLHSHCCYPCQPVILVTCHPSVRCHYDVDFNDYQIEEFCGRAVPP